MSLGQLTADYADSDVEDDQIQEQADSPAGQIKSSEQVKEAPPPPPISPLGSPADSSVQDISAKKSDQNNDINKTEQYTQSATSPKSSPKDESTAVPGLSGVIIDDDDDDPSPPERPSSASPHNQRVGELKAAEGGSGGRLTPNSNPGSVGSSKNTPVKKVNRLVSYYNEEDDDDLDDNTDTEEEPDEVLHSEPMDTGTDGEDDSREPPSASQSGGSRNTSHPSSPHGGSSNTTLPGGVVVVQGIRLPGPPVGKKCSQVLQDKIARVVEAVQRGEKDYNTIQNKKEFRNPSIYEKLVDHLRLDENGTNYPVALYDPHCWGKESFYEELARVQKEEMEKREKERKERTKVDFMSGTKKGLGGGEEEIKKRKSRFDSGRPESSAVSAGVTKPVGLANLPASVAPKTTIDAFGQLNKKPKI